MATIIKITLLALVLTLASSSVESGVVGPALAPAGYQFFAPPNVPPYAATYNTFTRGLVTSPYLGAGVLPHALAPRALYPAPALAPALAPAPLLHSPYVAPAPLFPAPLATAPLLPGGYAGYSVGPAPLLPGPSVVAGRSFHPAVAPYSPYAPGFGYPAPVLG